MHLVHQSGPAVPRDRLLRLPAVEALTGLKKSTLYALQKSGDFPRAVQVTPRCVAWKEAAVLQWVQDRQPVASSDGGAK